MMLTRKIRDKTEKEKEEKWALECLVPLRKAIKEISGKRLFTSPRKQLVQIRVDKLMVLGGRHMGKDLSLKRSKENI